MLRALKKLSSASVLFTGLLFVLTNAGTTLLAQRRAPARRPAAATQPKAKPAAQAPREPELKIERLPPDPAVEAADIAITANVRARSLMFETVPNPTVTFPGSHARDTVWEAQRENLPTPVEPGVTYRNIGIRLKITSVFRDIDRIVAEALGEVPVQNDPKTAAVESTEKSLSDNKPKTSSTTDRPRPPKRER